MLFSIVVPIYNNSENIEDTTEKLFSLKNYLPGYSIQIVFVDDGSIDNSIEILKKVNQNHKDETKIIKLSRNFGQIYATLAGLTYADGDVIGIISADLQDPYQLFIDMIHYWEQGKKIIVAERESREDSGISILFSKLYWKVIAKFGIKDFPEGGFDFCLLDKQIATVLCHISEKNTNIFPLIYWLGFEPKVLSSTRYQRTVGKSGWTFFKKIKLTIDTLIGFTYLPSRFITYSGFFISLSALFFSIYILFNYMIFGVAVKGWTSVMMVTLIIGGVTTLSLGILSEYVLRILDEVRGRPSFIVDQIIHNKEV